MDRIKSEEMNEEPNLKHLIDWLITQWGESQQMVTKYRKMTDDILVRCNMWRLATLALATICVILTAILGVKK